jgi:hypothetical protein
MLNTCRYTGNHEGPVQFIVHEGSKQYAACNRHAKLKAAFGFKVEENKDGPAQASLFDPKPKHSRKSKAK